jgi:myo-inositol-1(or 4)-monophosphatase
MSQEVVHLLEFARELASASAGVILPQFRKNIAIEVKQAKDWDPVTEGDKAAERLIRSLIEKNFPDHGIIGEEYGTKTGTSAYTWVLDPIDGTRSFVIGMPTWATLIGLYRDGKPLLGVMNQPYVGDMFYGSPDGAWLDHRGQIQHAAAGTTSPHLYDAKSNFESMRKSVQLMRYGGDAYFFSLVAAGHLDIAMDAGLQIYDIAALIPIITGAGGVVGTWDGKDPSLGGNIIAASNPALLDEARALMQS